MKKLIFSIFACLALNANEVAELTKKAGEYESVGDYKNAMILYKKAALLAQGDLALESQTKNNSNLNIQVESKTETSNLNIQSQSKPEIKTSNLDFDNENLYDIELHRDNYILPFTHNSNRNKGDRSLETKFQISLKKALWEDMFGSGANLNLAYTQTSWWQTAKTSAPFRETNYMPEIFVDMPLSKWLENSEINVVPNFRVGILHNSNGKGDEDSRSWNRIYAKAFWHFGNFSVSPRIWLRIHDKSDDNPHIQKYAGLGDIELRYHFGQHSLRLTLANNLSFSHNRGNVELGYYFPIFNGFYGYLQYFNGYAESMIDYDKSTNRIGVGFLIK